MQILSLLYKGYEFWCSPGSWNPSPTHLYARQQAEKGLKKNLRKKKMSRVLRQNFLPNPTRLRTYLLVPTTENQCLSKTGCRKGAWESAEPKVATHTREGWVSVAADGPREKPSSQDLCAQLPSFPLTHQILTSVLCQLSILPRDWLSASTYSRLETKEEEGKTATNLRQALGQSIQASWTLRPRAHWEPAL